MPTQTLTQRKKVSTEVTKAAKEFKVYKVDDGKLKKIHKPDAGI